MIAGEDNIRATLFLALNLISMTACAHSLEGKWTTDCDQFGRHAIIFTVDFGEKDFTALGSLYERPGCGVKTVNAEFEGSYQTGQSHGDGLEFDYVPKNLTLTLLEPEVVRHYNENKICDFDNWAMNAPKDVLGQPNCVGIVPPPRGNKIYDIFRLKSDDDLKFSSFPTGMHITDRINRPRKIKPQAIRLWRVSVKSFNQVQRDLKVYDDHIAKKRREFAKIPADIKDIAWVKKKLAFMVEVDQYMRGYLKTPNSYRYSKKEKDFFWKQFGLRFEAMDKSNTANLKALLKNYSWFTISEFGKKADNDAWLLVQHADLDHGFQKEVLKILAGLWEIGETNPRNYAYLFDRVAASFNNPSRRVPQRYGTQGSCVAPGKWEPLEMEDPNNVDARRAEVGLELLQNYIDRFKDICN